MIAEILIAVVVGVLFGIFTGLTPGIHVNLIALLTVSLSPLLLSVFSLLGLACFIISLAITHSFLDSIPSVYLGAPDASQELGVLPGHRLLHKGEGHNAIVYTLMGSLLCLLLATILLPLFGWSMSLLQPYVSKIVGWLLIGVMVFMIIKDGRLWYKALVLFLLSGVLGISVLALPMEQPLFGLLSGLFGVSILLLSLQDANGIPAQDLSKGTGIQKRNLTKAALGATLVGYGAAFLPGLGSSQAAIIATYLVGDVGDEGFLTLVGGINTANMLISIATVFVLDKARNGAILAIRDLMGAVGFVEALVFVAVALLAGGVATLLALWLSKLFCRVIVKVDYELVVLGIIGFIVSLALVFDGWLGGVVLLVSTGLGVLAAQLGVGKNHLMGCLILPVILFFVL